MSLKEMSDVKVMQTVTYDIQPMTSHIDPVPFFSQPDARQEKLFSHRMLAYPLRDKVISIKDTLRKALICGYSFPKLVMLFLTVILTAWRLRKYVGKVTKENSVYKNVHIWLDIMELVKKSHRNPGREVMVNSALEIGAAILEHDPYYRSIGYRIAYYIIKQAELGNWITEPEPFPKAYSESWDDNIFLGGL